MRDFAELIVAIIAGTLLMIIAIPIVVFILAIALLCMLIGLVLTPFYLIGQGSARLARLVKVRKKPA